LNAFTVGLHHKTAQTHKTAHMRFVRGAGEHCHAPLDAFTTYGQVATHWYYLQLRYGTPTYREQKTHHYFAADHPFERAATTRTPFYQRTATARFWPVKTLAHLPAPQRHPSPTCVYTTEGRTDGRIPAAPSSNSAYITRSHPTHAPAETPPPTRLSVTLPYGPFYWTFWFPVLTDCALATCPCPVYHPLRGTRMAPSSPCQNPGRTRERALPRAGDLRH